MGWLKWKYNRWLFRKYRYSARRIPAIYIMFPLFSPSLYCAAAAEYYSSSVWRDIGE